ncbi:type I restriction endonuclease subunit R [Flexivirga oryzae]|uniref:Type I restriction enzyme endonuclease subunit n=1 Tax=Flexivirga oryzae TaxID=1794944 RepID=A0A839N0B6_9MICO|nr:type I restriction endonuclease subunit R [Flexivirga oryzae]MBB2890807.1 type I restriction enzyme R subunit [Flexivirga oryzae]
MKAFKEADWEQLALETLGELGWQVIPGPQLAPGSGERQSWSDLVLHGRLLERVHALNPSVPDNVLQQAISDILSPTSTDALTENHRMHDVLVHGYRGATYLDHNGIEQTPTIRLISHEPSENDWVAANQLTIRSHEHERRFDIVLYLNGLPVSIIELKRAGSKQATAAGAHAQLQTYVREFPLAFAQADFVIASDGITARYGTPFTPYNHFASWNVDDDGHPLEMGEPGPDVEPVFELETNLEGLCNQERFLQLQRDFTAYDNDEKTGLAMRIAKPHQYFAVTKAVGSTIDAMRSDGKAGVVWHTQGSGKSMEMELFAARIAREPAMHNPTIVVITDRNELDGQLYESFTKSLLLTEHPLQVTKREQLRTELSQRSSGGIIFTTLQKFGRTQAERDSGAAHPMLCDRRNVVVIVDEAHRSHYDDLDGYARHLKDALPHATLIAFTGTPITSADRNTRKVFGDHIDIYDLNRAVDDGATVPVYFEPRLIKVVRAEGYDDNLVDEAADEATTGLDEAERAKVEQGVAVLNAVYGAPARLTQLADDLVAHWEQRRKAMEPFMGVPGKAMIVCATREIAAKLYAELVDRRPDWHNDAVDKGKLKVVYSGDPSEQNPIIAEHVRKPSLNAAIKKRFKEADDELELVIVKDMMLTGYDSPPLHTLYVDRPIKGALLMQTLARVNRTYKQKPDGLLVAYAPIAEDLSRALEEFTVAGGRDQRDAVGKDVAAAGELLHDLVDQIREMVAGVDWKQIIAADPKRGWIVAARQVVDHLRSPATAGNASDDGSLPLAAAYRKASGQLARAWALCAGGDQPDAVRYEVAFYEEVRVWMAKYDAELRQANGEPVPEDIALLLGKIIVDATDSDEILDIFEASGLPRQSLADLTPEFLTQATKSSTPHLAIEALRASILKEAARSTGQNLIRQQQFSERLTALMTKYTNQQLTSAEVIAALVEMAKEVSAEGNRGKHFQPPLDDKELAFYDVVSTNESAVDVMGGDVLAQIARDLVAVMRRDTRTDWTVRDDVKAKLRSSIKRLLVKNGYPPDKQPGAIKLVIDQMEAMAPTFAEERKAQVSGEPDAAS